jgi:hypothetical protein
MAGTPDLSASFSLDQPTTVLAARDYCGVNTRRSLSQVFRYPRSRKGVAISDFLQSILDALRSSP